MTVYFISPTDNLELVKIGQTQDLETRLTALGSAHEGGIELLAQCEGCADAEAAFHQMFVSDRVEGEWFQKSSLLEAVVEKFSANVTGKRSFGTRKPVQFDGQSPVDVDRKAAKRLLTDLLSSERAGTSLAVAQERAFQKLHAANPLWTRRRVRAIWEGAPKRIEFYEIRDMLQLLHAGKAERRAAFAAWLIEGDDQ